MFRGVHNPSLIHVQSTKFNLNQPCDNALLPLNALPWEILKTTMCKSRTLADLTSAELTAIRFFPF